MKDRNQILAYIGLFLLTLGAAFLLGHALATWIVD